jgi:hypothetical protein
MVRILAASFMDEDSAASAMRELDARFSTDGAGVSVAALGRASQPGGPTTILAGRFREEVIAAVRHAVEGFGGTVVVDVDEGATHRP